MTTRQPIRTSDSRWRLQLAEACERRRNVVLINDAGVRIDTDDLPASVREALSAGEWAAAGVLTAVGMAGTWMIRAAVLDPEPTSRLGLLIAGGVACLIGGGTGAASILTRRKPPKVIVTRGGFELEWQ